MPWALPTAALLQMPLWPTSSSDPVCRPWGARSLQPCGLGLTHNHLQSLQAIRRPPTKTHSKQATSNWVPPLTLQTGCMMHSWPSPELEALRRCFWLESRGRVPSWQGKSKSSGSALRETRRPNGAGSGFERGRCCYESTKSSHYPPAWLDIVPFWVLAP